MGTVDLSVLEDLDEGAGEAKEEKKETTGTTLLKKTLVINGAERMFVCNTEKDSLANVLRRLGLTGTKIGCGKGQCGACSVILNGKVVRSCMRKIKSIADYSEVETIEGLGTASNLHPLQLAWIKYGGVQCGFCTPGFIVSAKQLLAENPNPSRDEVRAWFQKHHNICRCTGYKPIVDCVMAAAEVMRGEKPREALEWKLPEDGRIYNTGIPRPAALAKVLGTADYGDDIAMKMPENTLHLALVLPGLSHANIKGIDFSEAEKAAGVFKVVTAADVKGINRITWPVGHPRSKADGFEHPILMDKKVFRYGDPVAVVCADTREHAREAAKLVKLDLEPLPEYDYATDAMQDDAMEIHPGIPNVFVTVPVFKGEDAGKVIADKSKTEYVVEGSFSSSREPHLTIEPDVAQAYVDANGVVTVHCKSLALHLTLGVMAAGIGVTADKIRVIENPTGASFGYTMSPTTPAIVAVCALATGHPVTLTCDYEEHMHFTGKRAPSFSNGKMGCDKDGNLTGLEYEIVYDKGAYTETAGMLLPVGLRFFGHPYYFPNVTGLTKCAFSNHAFSTAYRGFGSPQTYTASEQLIDMLAE
ncbi:MAG: molybdopterin-dependent oxidoreductase, partial [Clostridiales Family XIII bacterium]|nr:molybdopterin-dependent oxidoreductase [Clostridiales Family XIII bacterium]